MRKEGLCWWGKCDSSKLHPVTIKHIHLKVDFFFQFSIVPIQCAELFFALQIVPNDTHHKMNYKPQRRKIDNINKCNNISQFCPK